MTYASLLRFDLLSGVPHAYADARAFGGFDASRADDRAKLLREVGGSALVATRQTHSANVARVRAGDVPSGAGGVDALVSDDPAALLHAISADCPLLFLAAPDGRAVGVAHCGWRGIARGMVHEVVTAFDAFDVPPESLRAAISPGARGCCYEVGADVLAAFAARGLTSCDYLRSRRREDGSESTSADLESAIRALLAREGVAQIDAAGACTICGGERFHSHRRGGRGRMAGVIRCA